MIRCCFFAISLLWVSFAQSQENTEETLTNEAVVEEDSVQAKGDAQTEDVEKDSVQVESGVPTEDVGAVVEPTELRKGERQRQERQEAIDRERATPESRFKAKAYQRATEREEKQKERLERKAQVDTSFRKKAVERAQERTEKRQEKLKEREERRSRFGEKAKQRQQERELKKREKLERRRN